MEEHLKVVAEGFFGREALGFHEIERDEFEVNCPHPMQEYGILYENVKIEAVKDNKGDMVGHGGLCSCGILYYRLPNR